MKEPLGAAVNLAVPVTAPQRTEHMLNVAVDISDRCTVISADVAAPTQNWPGLSRMTGAADEQPTRYETVDRASEPLGVDAGCVSDGDPGRLEHQSIFDRDAERPTQ
ncbi:MAG: hypothetical protein K8T89_18325 [Planctomycetes bacterium]|nr:hypothetical protein [Planctomycetota bacterium]